MRGQGIRRIRDGNRSKYPREKKEKLATSRNFSPAAASIMHP